MTARGFNVSFLTRDFSVGNIMIADNCEGMLIDWDLCNVFPQRRPSQTEGPEEVTVARRLERTVSPNLFFSAQIFEFAFRVPGSSCPAGYSKIKIHSKIIATTVNLLYGSCFGSLSDILRQEARDRNVNMI